MAVNNNIIQNPQRKGLSSITEVQRYGRQLKDIMSRQPGSRQNASYKEFELKERPWHENTIKATGKGGAKAVESAINFIPDVFGAEDRWATFSDYIADNPHSTQFQVVEDIAQLATGIFGGRPILKFFQKGSKAAHAELRAIQRRKAGKRGRPTLERAWDIAKEGAPLGALAEMLAFRGNDEHLLLEAFFSDNPDWKNAYDSATANEGWENEPTTTVSGRFQQALQNIIGRAAFAAEGATIGAAANFLIAGGKATVRAGKDRILARAAKGMDEAGEASADTTAEITARKKLDDVRQKQEDAAFQEVAEAKENLTREQLNAQENAGMSKGPEGGPQSQRSTDLVPDQLDDLHVRDAQGTAHGARGTVDPETGELNVKLFRTAPVAREGAAFTVRHVSDQATTGGSKLLTKEQDGKYVIHVDRNAVKQEWEAAKKYGDNYIKLAPENSGIHFNPSTAFDNPVDFERYLIEREKSRLHFPQLVEELDDAYARRLEKHAVNEAKRKGIGHFYKYEFDAPNHLTHLKLTEEEKLLVLFKDEVKPEGMMKIVKMLTGETKGIGPARIVQEAESIMRMDTSYSDEGMKYFQGRLMHFFMSSLRKNSAAYKDTDTFAKAVGYLHDPNGTLAEVMHEHLFDSLDDLASANGVSPRAMLHRVMKGRGDARHLYSDMDSKGIVDEGLKQDVKGMKEMHIRIMAYRMEQAIGMTQFRNLTKQVAETSLEELRDSPLLKKYIIEMEKQASKIEKVQKLRQASGRILRAWHDFNDPALTGIETGRSLNSNGGIHQIKAHAQRTDAIIDGADNLMDATTASADALIKRTSLVDVHNEYWINSILSGTKTQVVNLISTGLHMYYKPLEGVLGGIGDKNTQRAMVTTLVKTAMINVQVTRVLAKLGANKAGRLIKAIDEKAYLKNREDIFKGKGGAATDSYEQAVGAVAGARKSFRSAEGTLTKSADLFDVTPVGVIGRDILGENSSEIAKETLDFMGNLIRIPSRLMIGSDELFKQISFRASAMGKLTADGIENFQARTKLDPSHPQWLPDTPNGMPSQEQLAKFTAEGFHGLIRASGMKHSQKNIKAEARRAYSKKQEEAQKTLTPFEVDRDAFTKDYVNKHWNASSEKTADYAAHWMEDVTFTRSLDADLRELQDLGKVSKNKSSFMQDGQDIVHKHPWMRIITPFIKTPANILKWPFQRMPFVMSPKGTLMGKEFEWVKNLHMRYQADMASKDPLRVAQAKGRLYAGRFYWAGFVYAASTDTITGAGPSNPREKRNWMATGKRPYSVLVGDKYISYARLDPFALPLGLAADLYEKGQSLLEDGDVDDDWIQATMMAGAYSLSNNMANKSYLAGINNVLQALIDPEHNFAALLKTQATSYIPRIGSQWTPITDDRYMKKTYGILEGIIARIPGAASSIEPMRNYLGEPMEAMYKPTVWASGINPFMVSKAVDDPVLEEIAHLRYGFGPPTPKIKGSRYLDMRKFHVTRDDGRTQSAFDRYQELIGQVGRKTKLRGALAKLFNSNPYHRATYLADNDLLKFKGTQRDPRVKYVKAIMYHYRSAAKAQTLKEYPELLKAVQAFDQTVHSQLLDIVKG